MTDNIFHALVGVSNFVNCLILGVEVNTLDFKRHVCALQAEDKDLCMGVLLALRGFIDENPAEALRRFQEVEVPGTEKKVSDFLTVKEVINRAESLRL